MIIKMFCVFDVKAEAYQPPLFLLTEGQAVRAFGDAIANSNHEFSRHPEDYTLFEVGEFDDKHAGFDLLRSPRVVATGLELFARSEAKARQMELQYAQEREWSDAEAARDKEMKNGS